MFGTLADFDDLLAARARARHEARDGPRGQPHLGRAPVVRRVPLEPTTRSATGTGGARRAPGWRRATPAPSRTTGARSSPARPGSSTRPAASTTCTCSRASSRTSTGRTRRSAQAIYAMMRWWLDRGRRRLPDGRHQHDLQGPALPDGVLVHGACGDGAALHLRPAHPRVPARDAPRGVRRPRRAADRRRDARRHRRARRGCSPTRPAARSTWSSSSSTWSVDRGADASGTSTRCDLLDLKAIFGPLAGRPGRRRLEQPLLEQPRPAARGVALRRRRRAPRALGQDARRRCCTCTAARRTSTRARSSG